jgi:eukaryotic-like serine/threonine-protein kinase
MPLNPGIRLGPYEILAPIGAGGMGEVYKARDTRLDRTVAVKVLPSHVAASPDVRERFEREAKAVSSLNHPNICTLHDIGEQDGVDYLVMEYLEGETLARKIEKGPIPTDDLLRYAIDVADALDRAHRGGLIHRDLKPGNIMISKSGTKLLDFGLAKSIGSAAAPSNLTASPTMTSPLTAAGTLVGTFRYMAPEQLEGSEADPRSDIFAFGAVLYEMATGQPAFEGKTQASLIAAILKEQPRPIPEIRPMSPAALDRIVRQCLAKDPDERWQGAGDLKRALKWIAESGSQASAQSVPLPAAPIRRGRAWLPWTAALVLAAGAAAGGYLSHRPAPRPVVRTSVLLPPGATLDSQNAPVALSPDGTKLAIVASEADGPQRLWVRPLDSLVAQPLAGTEGATCPFWSPDGQLVGFFADHKLKKVPANGGTAVTLCDADDGRGGSWSRTGTIVFAPDPFGALMQIPAAGGTPVAVTTVDKATLTHRLPHFLPDGNRLLFLTASGNVGGKDNEIRSLDLKTKETKVVAKADGEGFYAEPGYLVCVRDGNLTAQPLDAASLSTRGEAVPIAEKVTFNPFRYTGVYTMSGTGLLLFQAGVPVPKSQLTWFDIDGKKGATVGDAVTFVGASRPALSPDGRHAAAAIQSAGDKIDIWTYDLDRGVGTRFTFGPSLCTFPLWTPDGRNIVYSDGTGRLSIKAADGASDATLLVSTDMGGRLVPLSVTPDGSFLAYRAQGGKSRWDIWIVPLRGDRKPYPFLATPASEGGAEFSPDGKWMAYTSNESGKDELFVVPFPGPGAKRQISSGGASAGFWIGDGHEIAYVTSGRKLVLVPLSLTGSNLAIGTPRPLFGGGQLPQGTGRLTADGRRYLAEVPLEQAIAPPFTLVSNWPAELQAK